MAVLIVAIILAGPAPAQQARLTADVVYGHKDGMALTYDVLYPDGEGNGAGILWMVSGGWVSRWAPPETTRARFADLLDAGFTVFVVRHGSAPRYKVPDALADVRRAVLHVGENAAEYGVDPARLGAYGWSAGGHLSLMLGLADEAEALELAAVVAYFPPVDLRDWVGPSERFPALDFDPGLADSTSPILFVSPDDPPTLLVHGDADDLVPLDHSERIFDALQEAGVASELVVIEDGGHLFREPGQQARAREAMIDWFERHLR